MPKTIYCCHRAEWLAIALLATIAAPLRAQSGTGPKPVTSSSSAPPPAEAAPSPAHPLSAKELRDAQIAADTQKLYELAQQLKAELDKTNKDTLSLTVVKKATEIEKLAHSISERMKSN